MSKGTFEQKVCFLENDTARMTTGFLLIINSFHPGHLYIYTHTDTCIISMGNGFM